MLKTFKWVYKLGVDQERQRIAGRLQIAAQGAVRNRDTAYDMLREIGKNESVKPKRKERLEFEMAVNDRVNEIIGELFRYNEEYITGSSFMFPENGGKK